MIVIALLLAAAVDSATVHRPDAPALDSAAAAPVLVGPRLDAGALTLMRPTRVPADTGRPHAIEYSDWYARRLAIHRWASYTELPLFAGEVVIGNRLITKRNRGEDTGNLKGQHLAIASGLGALFAVNTLTGAWNWWDSRNDPSNGKLRTVHTVLMLAADAGFLATAALGGGAGEGDEGEGGGGEGGGGNANAHRAAAYTSFGLATVGTLIMWFRRD